VTTAGRRRSIRSQDGQALVLTSLALVVLLGFAGLVVDIGRAYLVQRQLQQAVDAASLVGGQTLPDSAEAKAQAIVYSATGKNAHANSMSANAPTVSFKCLTTLVAQKVPCQIDPVAGTPCSTSAMPNGCNAVQVTQSADVPTTFARLFIPKFTVTARSTAGMRGGAPHPLNIMIVLDRTGSMDNNCDVAVKDDTGNSVVISSGSSKKIDCAKDGIRQLLSGLLPCNTNINGNCGAAAPLDQVGLMVFPALNAKNATNHDTGGNVAHKNIALETSASCSGELITKPAWYTPNSGFPTWFLQTSDVGYGSAPTNEVDRVTITQTSGQFTLTFAGQTTAPLNWNVDSASAVQTALQGLGSIGSGNVSVSRSNRVYTITYQGALGGKDVGPLSAAAVGPAPPAPSVLTTTNGGPASPAVNEIQTVTIPPQTSGFFRLTFSTPSGGSQTTVNIAYDAPASTVQTELRNLSNIGNNDVVVTKNPNNGDYTITFQNNLAGTDVAQISVAKVAGGGGGNPSSATTRTGSPAVPATNEVQKVTVTQAGGTFTLTFNGQTTADIAFDDDAGTVQTELRNLNNIGNNDVAVTKSPNNNTQAGTYTITFQNGLGGQDVAQLTAAAGTVTDPIVVNTPSIPGVSADYTFAPLSNNYRLSDNPGLNPSSSLVQAVTWSSCTGAKGQGSGITLAGFASEGAQGYPGNQYYGINALSNTYYTGALIAAQAELAAEAARFPLRSAQPVIILLSDGEANTGGTNPCRDAITAAQNAAAAGTQIYSIAYKLNSTALCQSSSGGNEVPNINAYTTMANIARNDDDPSQPDLTKFFCPGTTVQLPGLPCQDGSTLSQVFQSIATSLTTPRLFPDDTP
jgi:Flp pilus assembly protein TadG